jgi:protein subunit release factor B
MEKEKPRERVTIVSAKDLEISYFCGSGPGGQARNKVASGVQIKHVESGGIGRASDSRSQHDNKKKAFERLVQDPKMKFWIAKKVYEIKQGETLEKTVEDSLKPENLKFEIKNAVGQWEEVNDAYFDGLAAHEGE